LEGLAVELHLEGLARVMQRCAAVRVEFDWLGAGLLDFEA